MKSAKYTLNYDRYRMWLIIIWRHIESFNYVTILKTSSDYRFTICVEDQHVWSKSMPIWGSGVKALCHKLEPWRVPAIWFRTARWTRRGFCMGRPDLCSSPHWLRKYVSIWIHAKTESSYIMSRTTSTDPTAPLHPNSRRLCFWNTSTQIVSLNVWRNLQVKSEDQTLCI